ncbi:MAG TPA: glycosyltransferase family 39 protein [Candidatus Binataceae bacterium]|nr:glycosyltransferase family 39 protein [Candidatus Binataceae bacterium]
MLAGVLVVTALVYVRCLTNWFFSDDVIMIEKNRYISEWSFLWKSMTRDLWWFNNPDLNHAATTTFYQPMQSLWLGLGYHLFGASPVGWHLAKIALHLLVVVLVFRVAQILSGSTRVGLIAALLFGLLAVHAEPVVWATDVPEPLSTAFELGAFCLFIRRSSSGWKGLAGPLVLYALATFSHESAVMFPALIGAYVLLFENDRGLAPSTHDSPRASATARVGNAAALSAGFVGVALIYLGVRLAVLGQQQLFGFMTRVKTATLVQANIVPNVTVVHHSPAEILFTLPSVLLWYLKLLAIPWMAGPAHAADFVNSPSPGNFFAPLTVLLGLAIAGYLSMRNAPRAKLYLFCALWWMIAIAAAPIAGIKLGTGLVFDRYDYLASFAFCLLIADLAFSYAGGGIVRKRAVAGTVAALAAANAIALWRVQPVWHDNVSAFTRAVENAPLSARNRLSLVGALMGAGDFQAASRQLKAAAALAPDDAAIHFALAAVDMKLHRNEEAVRELKLYYDKAFPHRPPVTITLPPAGT